MSAPGSVRDDPAHRAPSPTPGSSETTESSTTPSSSLGPAQETNAAFAVPPSATTLP
jgi:hypothetical protein